VSEHHVAEDLAAYLSGDLDDTERRSVSDHLSRCAECAREYQALSSFWERLGRIPHEEPGAGLEQGFRRMLGAFEEGMRARSSASAPRHGAEGRLRPGRPAFQLLAAAAMVILGLIAGYRLNGRSGDGEELARLRQEVHGLTNLLTVSLLNQESASERLRGVSLGAQSDAPDPDINAALAYTLTHDRNVNVRLAALDVLSRSLGDPAVRRDIIRALPVQRSPLVQVALVDVIVGINDEGARDALKGAAQLPGLLPDVRKRIEQGIRQTL